MNDSDGVRGVDAIKGYLSEMPALRPLVMVMKGLLAQHGLASAAHSGISGYATICMVISFLQVSNGQKKSSL
jgi:non-canonical poly(A) RNA polymerase PAPD5/7